MMKFKLSILLGVTLFASLLSTSLPAQQSSAAFEPLPIKRESRFHYVVHMFDLEPALVNGKPAYDSWYYFSLRNAYERETIKDLNRDGQWGPVDLNKDGQIAPFFEGNLIKVEHDFNGDGVVDYLWEKMRIHNVEIEIRDYDLNGNVDQVLFRFPDRVYALQDHPDGQTTGEYGGFNRMVIEKLRTRRQDYEKKVYLFDNVLKFKRRSNLGKVNGMIQPLSSEYLNILLTILEGNAVHDSDYTHVFLRMTDAKAMLSKHFRICTDKKVPVDVRMLACKTAHEESLRLLDLPAWEDLQVSLAYDWTGVNLKDSGEHTLGTMSSQLWLLTNPLAFRNELEMWLSVVDHEVLHAIQNKRHFQRQLRSFNKSRSSETQVELSFWEFITCLQREQKDHNMWRTAYWQSGCEDVSQDDFKELMKLYEPFDVEETTYNELEAYWNMLERHQYYISFEENVLSPGRSLSFRNQVSFALLDYWDIIREEGIQPPTHYEHLYSLMSDQVSSVRKIMNSYLGTKERIRKREKKRQERLQKYRDRVAKQNAYRLAHPQQD